MLIVKGDDLQAPLLLDQHGAKFALPAPRLSPPFEGLIDPVPAPHFGSIRMDLDIHSLKAIFKLLALIEKEGVDPFDLFKSILLILKGSL